MSDTKNKPNGRYAHLPVVVKVRPTIEARFLDFMLYVASEEEVGTWLACPLEPTKVTKTGKYAKGTVHTQYDTCRRKYASQFPVLANVEFANVGAQTLIRRTK